jgi:hypothetical protein
MPNIPPVERLAKQLCKALATAPDAETARHALATLRDLRGEATVGVAVALAVGRQWLVERDGALFLTGHGMAVATKSRSGIAHEKRAAVF